MHTKTFLLAGLLLGSTILSAQAQSKKSHKKASSHKSATTHKSSKKSTSHKKTSRHRHEEEAEEETVHTERSIHRRSSIGKINSDIFFKLDLKKDDKMANIYSRTIAYKGDDFADVVNHISGSSTYTVVDDDSLSPIFDAIDYYDGSRTSSGKFMTGVNGKSSYNGKAYTNTSASGLLYNQVLWGTAPGSVQEGDTWNVNISQAWELGGAGTQTVTVMAMDVRNHTITLKREGTSEGFYDSDYKQITITTKDGKKIKADVTPGQSHWTGYTTFKNGLVMSDELLVTRPITLTADGGINFKAQEREYILLNNMPADNADLLF
jgi:hypothetical protein